MLHNIVFSLVSVSNSDNSLSWLLRLPEVSRKRRVLKKVCLCLLQQKYFLLTHFLSKIHESGEKCNVSGNYYFMAVCSFWYVYI